MEEKIKSAFKEISFTYFIMYGSALLWGFLIYYWYYPYSKGQNFEISNEMRISISSLVILYIMISIPLSLGGFFWLTKKWRTMPSKEERLSKYTKFAHLRLILIGFGFIFGILAFAVLQDNSMMYGAGMSAIALVFCKPTLAKIVNDLDLEEEENN